MLCDMCEKEFNANLETVLKTLASAPVDAPVLHFTYPKRKDMNMGHFFDWFRAMELYSRLAARWESQERGHVCSVDRAGGNWVFPELFKMFCYLQEPE